MKRLLVILTLIAIWVSPAWSFQLIFDGGDSFYRPADLAGARPGPGVFPMPPDMGFDFDTAPAGYEDAVRWGLGVWEGVSTATLTFNDLGDRQCEPMWFCQDGVNNLVWVSSDWIFGAGVLGMTVFEDYNSTTGALWEADVYFNGQGFRWFTGDAPVPGAYDLKSVAVHELGHVIALDDLYDYHFAESTMYGYGEPASLRARTLDADDEDGITFLYPLNEGVLPFPGITGIKSSSQTAYSNTLAAYQGDILTNVGIEGYGFVYTTEEAKIWQGGAEVPSPAADDLSFTDSQHLTITLDLSANPATGEYDLLIINPNGKSAMLPGGIQPNLAGNDQPTVYTIGIDQGYLGSTYTTCATAYDTAGDTDGDAPLVYKWTLVVQPEGAAISLIDADRQCVTFIPVVLGWYAIEVAVSDGVVWSAIDGMEIQIITPATPPSSVSAGGSPGCAGCAVDGSSPAELIFPLLMIISVWWLIRRRKVA